MLTGLGFGTLATALLARIEHGRVDIDTGIARLMGALTGLAGAPVDELCDRVLERVVPGRADDDIALLAVRCHPEDGGRPARGRVVDARSRGAGPARGTRAPRGAAHR